MMKKKLLFLLAMLLGILSGAQAATKTYMLKTSGSIDTTKGYLIVYQDGTSATSASLMKSSSTSRAEDSRAGCILVGSTATITNGIITVDDTNDFSFEDAGNDTYYLKNNAGYYYSSCSSNEWLTVDKKTKQAHRITFDGSAVKLTSTYKDKLSLGYSATCGGYVPGFYYGGSDAVYLYEEFSNYAIVVNQPEFGGTISANVPSAGQGDTVILSNDPAAHYNFVSYTVTDASGKAVEVNNGTFTMPASNVTVTGTFEKEQVTYTVVIAGDPTGTATVTYKGTSYSNGSTFTTNAELSKSDFEPSTVDGYFSTVNIDEQTITVTYAKSIVYSDSYDNAKWYAWKVGGKYIAYNAAASSSNTSCTTSSTPTTDPTAFGGGGEDLTDAIDYASISNYLWAFGGEASTAFVYNMAVGNFETALYRGQYPGSIDWPNDQTYTYAPYFERKGTTCITDNDKTTADGTAWTIDGGEKSFNIKGAGRWGDEYAVYHTSFSKLMMYKNSTGDGVTAAMSLEEFANYTVNAVDNNGNTMSEGGVTFQGQDYTSNFYAPTTLAVGELAGISVEGYDNPTITLNDKTVTVTYRQKTYTITKGSHEHGDFTVSPEGKQPKGQTITLTVTSSDSGYAIKSWNVYKTEDINTTVEVNADSTFTMPAYDVTVDAIFSPEYTITCSETTGGKVEPSSTTAFADDQVTLTITPDDSYKLGKLTVDGVDYTSQVKEGEGNSFTYTLTMPAKDVTVNATFKELKSCNINFITDGNGTVTAYSSSDDDTPIKSAREGAEVMLTVNPDDGYTLSKLVAADTDGNEVTIDNNTFTMPASDVTITASFTKTIDGTSYTVSNSYGEKSGTPVTYSGRECYPTWTSNKEDPVVLTLSSYSDANRTTPYGAIYFGNSFRLIATQSTIYYELTINKDCYKIESYNIAFTNDNASTTITSGKDNNNTTFSVSQNSTNNTCDLKVSSFTVQVVPVSYKITYNNCDGATNVNPDTYTVEDEFTLVDPTKVGYTFDGWTDSEDNKVTKITLNSKGDIVLTAHFTPINYSITYDIGAGATLPESNPKSYTVESSPFTLKKPNRDGYTFQGWTCDDVTLSDGTIPTGTTGNKYYTANWTPKEGTTEDKNIALVGNGSVTDDVINQAKTSHVATGNTLVYVDDPEYENTNNMQNVIVKSGTDDNPTYTCSNFVLEDKVDFSCPIGFTGAKTDKAIYTRSVTNSWGTICLPYAPTAETGVTYYELTDSNVDNNTGNGTLTFTSVDELEANKPYVFKKSDTSDYTTTSSNVTVVKTPSEDMDVSSSTTNWTLRGTYKYTIVYETVEPNAYYIKSNKFWKINGNFNISAFRAYFIDKSSNAKATSFSIEENNEIIDALNTLTNSEDEVEGYYNINGIKQNDVQKGLNIIKFKSGKTVKVMIK